jgi:hypothetical protein
MRNLSYDQTLGNRTIGIAVYALPASVSFYPDMARRHINDRHRVWGSGIDSISFECDNALYYLLVGIGRTPADHVSR